jgi:hypothetical protein
MCVHGRQESFRVSNTPMSESRILYLKKLKKYIYFLYLKIEVKIDIDIDIDIIYIIYTK